MEKKSKLVVYKKNSRKIENQCVQKDPVTFAWRRRQTFQPTTMGTFILKYNKRIFLREKFALIFLPDAVAINTLGC